jgi:cellulose synthase/poly-beta-1,6-N-acetylglucosamine synthase-like glycosyltransferase
MRVYILDDSSSNKAKTEINDFVMSHPSCRHVTRPDRCGFKAGNINHALRENVQENYILLVDADQLLPTDFIRRLVERAETDLDPRPVFFQAANQPIEKEDMSPFQRNMCPEISIFYERDLSARERFGFVPLLGHGALIRQDDCIGIDAFPELVSEDFAFALRAARKGKRGTYAADIVSGEAYPYDFGAFMTRLKKFSSGSEELLEKECSAFFFKRGASMAEKWDFFMAMLWYILMPMLVLNGFMSAYVVHILWELNFPYIHPVLPCLYSWLLIALFAVTLSATKNWKRAFYFYFWSTAIYTAALPVSAWSFLARPVAGPRFERTPKSKEHTSLKRPDTVLTIALGVAAILCGFAWMSPFSPVIVAQGTAYCSFPLYAHLCADSWVGKVARAPTWLPGMLHLAGLFAVWHYAT